MPEVPAPEECETMQEYYRKHLEEQTDEWAKRSLAAKVRVGVLPHPF